MSNPTLDRRSALVAATLLLSSALVAVPAVAGTATTTLGVSLTINAGCTVSSTPIAFPAQGVISAAVSQTGSLAVTCTNTTPYTVGLDQGAGSGATTTNRLMTGPASATVAYGLYSDSGHTANWGNASGSWVAGTGNGNAQTLTVHGAISPQTTPAPGAYADTINVTVTF
jgi:spore coat protein U-like protein